MMHLAIFIPDWNSLDSVRHVHSELEFAALVFFGLLVVFDVLAHFADENKNGEKLLEKIGLVCFAIAVIAEIGAYPYGQRNDTLSEQIIGSLDAKVKEANGNADKAVADSSNAQSQAEAAEDSAENADKAAGTAQGSSDAVMKDAKGISFLLKAVTPRGFLLNTSKESIARAVSPYAGQKVVVEQCRFSAPPGGSNNLARDTLEKDGTWSVLANILRDMGDWSVDGRILANCGFEDGVRIFANKGASPKTLKAANALSEELKKVLPEQPLPILFLGANNFGPFARADMPWALIAKDHDLIVVIVGTWPIPWMIPVPTRWAASKRK